LNKRRLYILALPLLVVIFFPRYAATEDIRSYTLSDLMNIAVQSNPSVAVFKANLAAARGVVMSAGAYPNPELEFRRGKGEPLDGSESGNEYSISIGQPIEWSGKRSFRKRLGISAKNLETVNALLNTVKILRPSHIPLNQWAKGSIPLRPTNNNKGLRRYVVAPFHFKQNHLGI